MKSAFALRVTAMALPLFLAACGGGGDDSGKGSLTPTSPPVPPTTAEGFYNGTTSTGYDLFAAVLENGELYALYARGGVLYGVMQGSGTSSSGTFKSTNVLDINLSTLTRTPATATATYVAKASLNGSVVEGAQTINFNSTYDSSYATPASLSTIAGVYSAQTATGTSAATASNLTITSGGLLTGNTPVGATSCSYSGTIVPRASGKNVYDVKVTFQGGACVLGTQTTTGIAIRATSGTVTRLYAVGLLPDRSDGFIALGTKL
ncbi:hypothetical protein SAMN05216345_104140 [Cupriavidus sp. YR651]|uniref:hypothetical protein n=1 Tax=Cupriavidus sp. YR651 TaxID=1855315 RepID=UPI00088E7CD7|nr:hypothetical protein [Cupriavidus sp. YR651]SDC84676.1 hypothetical protein SAMN05216345_104140 [Cupriavidus sp. YR651]